MFSAFLLLLVLSSPSAVLGLGLLLCSGSVVLQYDPPVTNETQALTATQWINYTTCLGILADGITAGWTQRVVHANQSCSVFNATVSEQPPVTFNFTWVATGTPYSTIYFPTGTSTAIDNSAQVLRTGGNVTSGALMGGNSRGKQPFVSS